jgi:hypothetical protein
MSIHQFRINFANRKNNKAVSLIGSLDESVWKFYQYGSFRSEYEGKYFSSEAEFMSALNKFTNNPSAMVCSVQMNSNLPTKFSYGTAEGNQQAAEAVAELIAKL